MVAGICIMKGEYNHSPRMSNRTEKGQFLLISAVMMQKAERKQTVPWRIFLSWLLYSCCLCSKGIKADKLKICLGSMKAFCRKKCMNHRWKTQFLLIHQAEGFQGVGDLTSISLHWSPQKWIKCFPILIKSFCVDGNLP